jgi:hypothetical protein
MLATVEGTTSASAGDDPVPSPAPSHIGIVNIPVPVDRANVAPAINYFFQVGHGPENGETKQGELGPNFVAESDTCSTGLHDSYRLDGLDTEDDAKFYSFVPERLRRDPVEEAHPGIADAFPPEVRGRPWVSPEAIPIYTSAVSGSETGSDRFTVELQTHDAATEPREPLFQWM